MELIKVTQADSVATITLNDPDKRNAVTLEMCDQMDATMTRLEEDETVKAIVITGAGKAFCAGADLSHLGDSAEEGLLSIYEGFLRVGRCPLPTIAAVNGAAVGAGMNLALICDLRLVARSARFDNRFIQLGLHPGGGHSWMFQNICGPQTAAAAILFSQVIDGTEAARLGLAYQVCDDHELLTTAQKIAATTANTSRELLIKTKQTMREVTTLNDQMAAVHHELGPQAWSTRQPVFADNLAKLKAKISSDK